LDSDLRGKKLLVTGGAGFIGSAFVRMALESGAERLVVLDSLSYAAHPANLAPLEQDARFRLLVGDVAEPANCREALELAEADWVVHLAAESHVDRSIDDPAPFLRTNVVGTGSLLEASLDHWRRLPAKHRVGFRFLHSSTDEVFGDRGDGPAADEDSPYAPSSPYSASKAASDLLVQAYGRTFGLPWIITHSGNNYGPRQFPEKLLPLAILRALAGEPIPVYGDGRQVREWLHVEDHCRALLLAGLRGRPGRSYCVGGGCRRGNLEILETVLQALGLALDATTLQHVADRPGHDRRYALDCSRFLQETGWEPRVSLEDGIAATVSWYQDQKDWIAVARERSGYQGERLGRRGALDGDRV